MPPDEATPSLARPTAAASRLRAADVIAYQQSIIAAMLDRGGGERSAVTLARNAKGETQIEVVVRTDDEELTTADLAMAKAQALYDAACQKYPTGSGFARNEGQRVE